MADATHSNAGAANGTRPRTILIVDDEEDIILSLRLLLESRWDGVDILPAGSGAAGLEIIEERAVDCIVTDYRMPGMDGVEFLRRARSVRPEAPAIMVTAFQDAIDELEKALNGARVPVLAKPLDIPVFLRTMENMLFAEVT